jgi:hypothetical protein
MSWSQQPSSSSSPSFPSPSPSPSILLLLPRPLLLLLPGVDKTENGKRMEKIKTEKTAQFLKRFYWFYYLCASVSLCTVFIYFLTLRSSLKMITIDQ